MHIYYNIPVKYFTFSTLVQRKHKFIIFIRLCLNVSLHPCKDSSHIFRTKSLGLALLKPWFKTQAVCTAVYRRQKHTICACGFIEWPRRSSNILLALPSRPYRRWRKILDLCNPKGFQCRSKIFDKN